MQLQILEIILWPRNTSFAPRRVEFQTGMVNVISGASKTGKSSVIPIIDYCLGSERCSVPVGTIRSACSWFGILIQTDEGKKLLARREPDDQISTGDMLILEGNDLVVPSSAPEKNSNIDAVKRLLDRLAGLTNLGFDPTEQGAGYKARPSFRDLLAFSFQPQNIVANPDVLFFRADTNEHREKLRTVFPYVLGATTPDLLAKQWELEQLQKILKRKERELAAQMQASDSWRAEILNWVAEASELGLLETNTYLNQNEQQLIQLLQKIVAESGKNIASPFRGIETASVEYSNLQREESEMALQLSVTRRRLDQIASVKSGLDGYSSGLQIQHERLGVSRWLKELTNSHSEKTCPICSGTMKGTHNEIDRMCDTLATLESSLKQVAPSPAILDKEFIAMKDMLRGQAEKLKAIRIRKKGYEERSKALAQGRQASANIDRYLGRLEQALKMFTARTVEESIQKEVNSLREQINTLRLEIAEAKQKNRLDAALAKISNLMGQITANLDAEQPDDPASLDIKELTVRVSGQNGRTDYLWEMGSGANWLSYHISATLALQRFFLDQPQTSVPSLVVYDQPSQVYFPHSSARSTNDEQFEQALPDEDIASIRRFFAAFGNAVSKSGERLQIIVLDHAGRDVWGELQGVTLVDEWRNGEKLVPMEWLS